MDGNCAVGVNGRIISAGFHTEYRLSSAVKIQAAVGINTVAVAVYVQISAVDINVVTACCLSVSAGVKAAASGTSAGIKGVSAARAGIRAVCAAACGVYAVVARDNIVTSGIDVYSAALESFIRCADVNVGVAVKAVFCAER